VSPEQFARCVLAFGVMLVVSWQHFNLTLDMALRRLEFRCWFWGRWWLMRAHHVRFRITLALLVGWYTVKARLC